LAGHEADVEAGQFGHPQAAGIQQFEHRAVAQLGRLGMAVAVRFHQAHGVVDGQAFGRRLARRGARTPSTGFAASASARQPV
jgi:hypothetical protein